MVLLKKINKKYQKTIIQQWKKGKQTIKNFQLYKDLVVIEIKR